MMPDPKAKLLIETYNLTNYKLEEAKSDTGKVVLRGVFARADVPTKNKRVYPRSLWEDNIKRMKPLMDSGAIYGELDHPMDGKTKLQRASHFLRDLTIDKDGTIIGAIELLPDKLGTPAAQLHSIVSAGGAIGVSSRGFGLTETDENGNTVVKDGTFFLDTFDAVADPAVGDAYPTVYYEDVCRGGDSCGAGGRGELSIEDLRTSYPTLVERIEAGAVASLEEQIQKATGIIGALTDRVRVLESADPDSVKRRLAIQVAEALAARKREMEEEIRSDILADPKTGGARGVVESIIKILRPYVGEDDTVYRELADAKMALSAERAKLDEAAGVIRQLTLSLVLERDMLSGVRCPSLVRTMMGRIGADETSESLTFRFNAVVKGLVESGVKVDPVGADSELRLKSLESKVADAERKLTEAEAQAHDLGEKAEKAIAESGTLRAKIGAMQASLRDKDAENKELQEQVEELEMAVEVEKLIAHRSDREAIRNTLLECDDIESAKLMLRRLPAGGGARRAISERVRGRVFQARGQGPTDDEADDGVGNVEAGYSRVGTRTANQRVLPTDSDLMEELESVGAKLPD